MAKIHDILKQYWGFDDFRPLQEDIIKEIENLVVSGYKEVTLLGQNVNAYGKDLDNEIDFLISNIRIEIEGANTFDKMWLFSGDNFTRSYDNGYDGRKIIGSTRQVQIFAVENDGIYQVNAVDHIHNTLQKYLQKQSAHHQTF